jgi:glycosyltransferase involved in cell wall biosynthesis
MASGFLHISHVVSLGCLRSEVTTRSRETELPVDVWVELAPTLDSEDWSRRHARGEVPDRLPYGLDRLASHGVVPRCRPPLRRRAVSFLDRAARKAGGYQWLESLLSTPPAGASARVCWDERTGVPAVLRSARSLPVVTGVIWLTEPTRHRSATDRLARAALCRAAGVWALSSAQLPILRERWRVPQSRLHWLPFGIDAEFFAPAGESDPSLVVSVGNDRHRDHATLVQGLARAQSRGTRLRLELVTRHLVDIPPGLGVRRAGLSHPGVRGLYGRAAVVAVATTPNQHVSGISVVLEAMAMARAVVVTDTPGMRDYVDHGQIGLLVPHGDPEALAESVQSLLADPARAEAMGRAGRLAVEKKFSTERQAEHLAAIIKSSS